MYVRNLSLALAAAAVLVWGQGCSRCHSGHYEVSYRAAYTTTDSHCSAHDKRGNCTRTTTETHYHPADCYDTWVCDWTCDALDKGRAEAHPKHAPFRQIKDSVDPHCAWDGVTARVKW